MKFPEVNFYCIKRNAHSELECRLITSICFEGKRIIYYPGIILKEYEWDRDEKMIVNRFDKDAMNDSLRSLKKQVIEIHQSLSIRYGRVTKKQFRDELRKIRIFPGKTLSELFLDFMEQNSSVWTTNTFLKCRSFYNWLKNFTDYYGSFVSIESVDQEFLQELVIFLRSRGISNNTLYSYFNLFKWFLNWASSKSLLINKDYKSFKLASIKRTKAEQTTKVILTSDEISKLLKSAHKERKLEHCRDIYCLMLFTGCTLSEIMELKKTDVNNEGIRIKGRNSRTIPFNNYSRKIVSRYQNKYFRVISLYTGKNEPPLKYLF
jgi:site-specific recombinase XerD